MSQSSNLSGFLLTGDTLDFKMPEIVSYSKEDPIDIEEVLRHYVIDIEESEPIEEKTTYEGEPYDKDRENPETDVENFKQLREENDERNQNRHDVKRMDKDNY